MKSFVSFVLFFCFVYGNEIKIQTYGSRIKRENAGALHILTNHAEPIHADVKSENAEVTEKPCKGSILPARIEPGPVFKVTAPNDVVFEPKSLRKSSPLINKTDLIRSISRVTTLAVLLILAVLEFYPMLQHLYDTIQQFVYMQ